MGLLVPVLLATPMASHAKKVNHTAGGCGPANVNFNVTSPNDVAPAPTPQAGKALVYVVQQMENNPDLSADEAITRVGVDGNWMGANHGNTYLYFQLAPGSHSVCVDWQSTLMARATLAAAANLNADAGDVYYFEVRTHDPTKDDAGYVKLRLVDSAEGQLLLGSSARVTSTAKK
jgi:Protein of unknown function (DUF2846)